MIEEAIKAIGTLAVEAAGAKHKVLELHPGAEPQHRYALVKPTGEIEFHDAHPMPRAHRMAGIAEVIPYVKEKGTETSVIWYDESKVVILLDDDTRRDVAACQLHYTPQFFRLIELQKPTYFDQKAFVRLLRIELADCLLDLRLLNFVRSIKFTATERTAGTVRQTRESLGRDIEMQLQGEVEGECPEETVLQCRLFTDPSLRDTFNIRCAVEVDMDAQRFALTPFPLECRNVIELQLNGIGKMLQEGLDAESNETPLFRGSP